MTTSSGIADHFDKQAAACAAMGSPFTAMICRESLALLDRSTATGRQVLDWPGDPRADALALRLAGGFHALVLRGEHESLVDAYPPNALNGAVLRDALATALDKHDGFLARFLKSPPQTNETGRSGVLLPGFLALARETGVPLALNEIGSSAGLNLFFDRFAYEFGPRTWGDPACSVRLTPEMRGSAVPLDGDIRIVERVGNDVAPIDIHDPDDTVRLRSYVWPDQAERVARMDAAISVARAGHFSIEACDAADFVRRRLAQREPGCCFVLFHSVMW